MSYFPRHPFQRLLNDELPPSISGWGPFEMMGCFNPCGPGGPRPPYVMTPLGAQPMQQPQQYLPPPQASYYAPSPNANVAWLAAQQQDYGGLPPNVDPSWSAPAPMPSGGPSPSFPGNVSLNGSADAYGDPNGGAAGFDVPAPHQDDLVKAAQQSQDDANQIFYGGAGAPRGPVVSGIVGALRSIRSLMHSQPQAGIGPVQTTPQYLPAQQRGLGGPLTMQNRNGQLMLLEMGQVFGTQSPHALRRPLQQSSYPNVAGVGALTSLKRMRVGPSPQPSATQVMPGAPFPTRHDYGSMVDARTGRIPAGTVPWHAKPGAVWTDTNGVVWRGQQGAFGVYGVPIGQKAVYPGGPHILGE